METQFIVKQKMDEVWKHNNPDFRILCSKFYKHESNLITHYKKFEFYSYMNKLFCSEI